MVAPRDSHCMYSTYSRRRAISLQSKSHASASLPEALASRTLEFEPARPHPSGFALPRVSALGPSAPLGARHGGPPPSASHRLASCPSATAGQRTTNWFDRGLDGSVLPRVGGNRSARAQSAPAAARESPGPGGDLRGPRRRRRQSRQPEADREPAPITYSGSVSLIPFVSCLTGWDAH